MTKRKIETHEKVLEDFSILFRKRVAEDIIYWNKLNPVHAEGRRFAYAACLRELKEALEQNNLTLSDIGLAGYEIPKLNTRK